MGPRHAMSLTIASLPHHALPGGAGVPRDAGIFAACSRSSVPATRLRGASRRLSEARRYPTGCRVQEPDIAHDGDSTWRDTAHQFPGPLPCKDAYIEAIKKRRSAEASGVSAFMLRDLLNHRTIAMANRYARRAGTALQQTQDAVGTQMLSPLYGSPGVEVTSLAEARSRRA